MAGVVDDWAADGRLLVFQKGAESGDVGGKEDFGVLVGGEASERVLPWRALKGEGVR